MRSRFNVVIVGVYMAIALAAGSYMAVNMGGVCRFNSCLTLKVEFKDAAGLLHSNDVRVAGVQAGQVKSIDIRKGLALVTVQLQSRYQPVYHDATAVVRPKNLLGETYVEIDRGTPGSGQLKEGDTIPLAQTLTPVQVDEVLNALDPSTRDKLQIVINGLGEAMAQRGQDLNLSAGDLQRISADLTVTSTTLADESADIDALLVQLDKIQQTASDYHDQLAVTLKHWDDVSRTLEKHDANFSDAFAHLDGLLATLDQGLTPNTAALARTIPTLPQTIDDADNFLGLTDKINLALLTGPGGGAGPAAQDGIDLLPRLAQVMIGAYGCDTHIYANYANVPGQTEPATCPQSGTPLTENFGGADKGDASTGGNRHLWRVMGMFDVTQGAKCGDVVPGGMPPSSPLCAPGTDGSEPYRQPANSGATASGASGGANPLSPAAARPPSSQRSFFAQLWADLTGGWDA